MQRVLDIEELLDSIFRFIDDAQTLLNVALTCRRFCETAGRVLWNTFGDLVHWLRLLPPDLCEVIGSDSYGRRLKFLRPPTADDFLPIKRYSNWLRKISVDEKIGHGILLQIHTVTPLPSLFPNVHSVGYYRTQPNPRLLLSSQSWNLTLDSYLHELTETIRLIPIICPKLQQLRFQSPLIPRERPEQPGALASILFQCDNLRAVYFRSVFFDQACLTNLGALANLRTLGWAWDCSLEVFRGSAPVGPFFPELLHYTQSHMSDFQSFMKLTRLFTAPKLEKIDLTCHNISRLRLEEVFTVLDRFDHHALEEIKITRFTWSWIRTEALGNDPINIITLFPLFPFRNLRVIVINDTGTHRRPLRFDFDNRTLGDIASHFPLLETLIFGFRESDETWIKPYKITLPGILQLVERCPKLRELHLRFNLATDDCPSIDPGFTGSCPDLHTLNIWDSPIKNGDMMGAILARLFPKPPALSFDPCVKEWKEVRKVFTALRGD